MSKFIFAFALAFFAGCSHKFPEHSPEEKAGLIYFILQAVEKEQANANQ